ncbi:hypothetical protein [Actinacidiphila alni]|uniref:hypothetical protein n=1 Tax=Actinacidiphila alni TaxID=380248 RepID=UPI003455EA01
MNRPAPFGQHPPALRVLDASVPAAPILAGRVLLHENTRYIPHQRGAIDNSLGGVVLTGDNAETRAFKLRTEAGFTGTMLIDSAPYKSYTATEDEPFLLPHDQMFPSLEDSLSFQKAGGASAALTPTGYIPPAASKILKAVIREAHRIERADTVVTLPVDVTWLSNERVDQLIAACTRIKQPKALIMVGQFDPLEHLKVNPANLRRVITEVENMMLLRSDLAALDAMAQGALCAGIGVSSTVRHCVAPGERAAVSGGGGPQYPSVLMPDLMCFTGAQALSNRYANAESATCSCDVCDGRGLDRFLKADGETRVEAEDHNVLTWSAWVGEMACYEAGPKRKAWWQAKCAAALARYPLENERIGLSAGRAGFKPPSPLEAWATLPAS